MSKAHFIAIFKYILSQNNKNIGKISMKRINFKITKYFKTFSLKVICESRLLAVQQFFGSLRKTDNLDKQLYAISITCGAFLK